MFPRDYPFKPPRIKFFTPQGRFEINYPICTSFSDYHPESWDPSWSVQTIVLGLISFMLSKEITAGGIRTTDEKKKLLAKQSVAWNFKKEEQFVKLFGDYFAMVGIDGVTKKAIVKEEVKNDEEVKRKESNPIDAFEAELAKSESGRGYEQVMSMEDFDNQLSLMKTNNQCVILLDFTSKLSGEGGFLQEH